MLEMELGEVLGKGMGKGNEGRVFVLMPVGRLNEYECELFGWVKLCCKSMIALSMKLIVLVFNLYHLPVAKLIEL
jgi:hypothetical protein